MSHGRCRDATICEATACQLAERAQRASRELAVVSGAQKNAWLKLCAERLRERTDELLAESTPRTSPPRPTSA